MINTSIKNGIGNDEEKQKEVMQMTAGHNFKCPASSAIHDILNKHI